MFKQQIALYETLIDVWGCNHDSIVYVYIYPLQNIKAMSTSFMVFLQVKVRIVKMER